MENPATAGFWLSPQQKRVWSLQNDGRVYGSACMLIFEGVESPDSLAAVTEHLVAGHEILRTVYVRQPGMTYPFQVVLDNGTPPIQALDLSVMSAAEQTSKLNDLFLAAQVRSQRPERAPEVAELKVAERAAGLDNRGRNWRVFDLYECVRRHEFRSRPIRAEWPL